MEKNPMKSNVANTKKKKGRARRIINNIIIIILAFVLIGGVSMFFMLTNIISKVADKEATLKEKIVNSEPTSVLAADGEKIYEIGAESRELITYSQVPQVTIDAFLAIEDSRFYKHNGFDLPRFISSALSNLRSGSLAQGGSTLSMQTIDNFIMKPQEDADEEAGIKYSTLERIEHKIQEIYLSMRLETKLDKEEIMTAYLNKINFGSSARGIQKGAEYYFGKSVEELNLSESAFLAGVINAPNTYNPYFGYDEEKQLNYYEFAIDRRDETLHQMLNHGFISETEYQLALTTELAFQLKGKTEQSDNPYEDYAKAAIKEAANLTGMDPVTTPMTIYTGLNKTLQTELSKVGNTDLIQMPNNENYQFASSVINNSTGVVTAIHQGFNDNESYYQARATYNTHSPGSTMKPFLDYALTFDKLGWCTSRVIDDKKIIIDNSVTVVNSDGKYHGNVTLAEAIGKSYNTPALQALQALNDQAGRDYIVSYLKKIGFSDELAENFNMQYGIGASYMVATPMHISAIYAAMANGGYYIEPHLVTKVELHDGSKTYDVQPKKVQVMSEQAAYMISDLLYQAVNGESNVQNYFMGLAFSGVNYPVYGKTGTSDWGTEEDIRKFGGTMKDEWMVNYTNEYTIATWTGYDGGIAGKITAITDEILYMNIPGKINRHILDGLASTASKIQNPGKISSYGGGLIKSEWLADAAKNNPMTAMNITEKSKALKEAVDKAKALDSSKYTPESFAAVQTALKTAQEMIDKGDATQTEFDGATTTLKNAMDKLVEKKTETPTVKTDKTALYTAITNGGAYTNKTKYTASFVDALTTAINAGKKVYDDEKSTQEQITEATEAINIAITNCVNNPIVTPAPPEGTEQ